MTIPPTAAPAFAAAVSAGGERHYRARFDLLADYQPLPTSTCSLNPAGQPLTVFEALAADGTRGFAVDVRQNLGGGLEVCATAVLDSGEPAFSPVCAPMSDRRASVAIQGWAAAGGESDGGLRLWLDGALVGQALGLDNSLALVEQTLLGAVAVPAGAAGTVCLDNFESSR